MNFLRSFLCQKYHSCDCDIFNKENILKVSNQKGYWELARLAVRTNKNNDSFRWVSCEFNNN